MIDLNQSNSGIIGLMIAFFAITAVSRGNALASALTVAQLLLVSSQQYDYIPSPSLKTPISNSSFLGKSPDGKQHVRRGNYYLLNSLKKKTQPLSRLMQVDLSLLFFVLLLIVIPNCVSAETKQPMNTKYCALSSLKMLSLENRPVYSVKFFGAKGDGVTDDTVFLQKALDDTPSGSILEFPPGTYLHNSSLLLSKDGTILMGKGGVLKATNQEDQAIILSGSKSAIMNMVLHGTGSKRSSQPQTTKILIKGRWNQILNNEIQGGVSAGIFLYGAKDFRVVNNTVFETLADGIHMTNGSRRGLVEFNTVHYTGDDPIAVVSYQKDKDLSGDVIIRNNSAGDVSWGRGITVVGGENVLIENNTVSNITGAAGIMIAQEKSFKTDRVKNVIIRNNTVRNTQMMTKEKYTYMAAIDVNSNGQRPVENVYILDNSIENSRFAGVRVFGNICNVYITGNNMSGVLHREPIHTLDDPCAPEKIFCQENKVDGMPLVPKENFCTAADTGSQLFNDFGFSSPDTYSWQVCQ